MKHPIQPIETDAAGNPRFKENAIVRYLLEHGPHDMNHLARKEFSKEDRQQFAQLIGYSLRGYGELNYVDDDAYEAAEQISQGKPELQAKVEVLEQKLRAMRMALREPMAHLFGIHPDDLKRNL